MKTLDARNSFKKDLKRISKRGRHKARLENILALLASGQALPDSALPHKLSGDWEGVWECHVAPDLLLVYDFDETTVTLIRIGSHADLF